MGKDSAREWTDHTFNPWHGCVKVSPGCENCYAERFANRFYRTKVWGANANRLWMSKPYWNAPLKWKDKDPGRVFCGSMCDIFETHSDPVIDRKMTSERERLQGLIMETPNLEWLLLTKRIDNVKEMLYAGWWDRWPENVRLGITVVNQEEADRDIPKLLTLDVPNFLSLEPLLGEIDLIKAGAIEYDSAGDSRTAGDVINFARGLVDWVIVGGESGPNARPMHPDWVGTVMQHCSIAQVPFFFKQWGEYVPGQINKPASGDGTIHMQNGETTMFMTHSETKKQYAWGGGLFSVKVGKKEAGSLLYGREYKEFPE